MKNNKKLYTYLISIILLLFFSLYYFTNRLFDNNYIIENFIKQPGYSKKPLVLSNTSNLLIDLNNIFLDKNTSNVVLPIFFNNLPSGFLLNLDQNLRENMFITILLPLIIKLEQDIIQDRKLLLDIVSKLIYLPLDEKDLYTITRLANKYKISTSSVSIWDYSVALENLLLKVDIVPASLIIAVAIAETNWGNLNEAVKGNALFGSQALDLNISYNRVHYKKKYKSLLESVTDYYFALNTARRYSKFRENRLSSRISSYTQGAALDSYTDIVLNGDDGEYKENLYALNALQLINDLYTDVEDIKKLRDIITIKRLNNLNQKIIFDNTYTEVNIRIK